jgi:hypothetical protein
MKVPAIDNIGVKQLCSILKLPSITEIPIQSEDYANYKECVPNVEKKVKRDGGEIVLGWSFWELPFLVEAEFHAIWRSPSGDLIDITKKPVNLSNILFASQLDMSYSGVQISNVRLNTSGNELVDDFIKLHSAIFAIENKGFRAFENDFKLYGHEKELYNSIKTHIKMLNNIILNGSTINTACFCSSRKSYLECHRSLLLNQLKSI